MSDAVANLGLGFEWIQHANGSRTLLDVPIFLECERDGEVYDAEYVRTAFAALTRAEKRRKHLAPVNLGHRMLGRPEPEGAGFLKAARLGDLDGHLAIFADITLTNPRAIDLVFSDRLPYRSAEVIRPGRGDPGLEELALLDTAPFLAMPMTRPAPSPLGGGAVAVAIDRCEEACAPVRAFAAFNDRRLQILGDRVVPASQTTTQTAEKPRIRLAFDVSPTTDDPNGAWVARFAANDGDGDNGARDDDKPKGGDGEEDGEEAAAERAIDLVARLAKTEVPLEDAPAVVAALQDLLARLTAGPQTQGDPQVKRPSEEPANPNQPRPMNMGATNDTSATSAADAGRIAALEASNAGLAGRIAAFEARDQQETAIRAALKDLAPYSLGSDPEARIRKVVSESGEHWQVALQSFSATVKDGYPKNRTASTSATAAGTGAESEWPEEVRKVAKTPEEGEAAIRAFAAWKGAQARGINSDIPFATFWRYSRTSFMAA